MRSTVGIKICVITSGIIKYKSKVKKKKKKHDKIDLIGKDQLNIIEVLIFKELIDSYITHDKFLSVNNVLREYYEIKIEIKNLELLWNALYKNKENLMCQLQKIDCS